MSEFSFVDLFAGAGGFSEGLLLAGNNESRFRLIAASDIQLNAKLTHENRFQHQLGFDYSFIQEDINSDRFAAQLTGAVKSRLGQTNVDVVVGGPPCQGFSVFGQRNEDDPRNNLFLSYLRAITMLKPKYFVMENVPGLELMYSGRVVHRIRAEVEKMQEPAYTLIGPLKVNAANYGVPQLRERILFIGCREDMSVIDNITPTHTGEHITVRQAISDLSYLNTWDTETDYKLSHPPQTHYQEESRAGRLFKLLGKTRIDNTLNNHDAAKHSPLVIARFAMIEPGKGLDSIPKTLWDEHLKSSKRWCVRLHPDRPSFTVVTLPDDFVHYERHRILTVRELARLQSFDDTFEFLGARASGGGGKGNKKRSMELPQYSQVGNAVPPLLAKAVGQALLQALDNRLTLKERGVAYAYA